MCVYVCVCVCVCACVCVCFSVCLCDRRRTYYVNQSTDLVQIRYYGPLVNISSRFFSFPPTLKIKGSSHEKKNKNFDFLKSGSNDFD